MNNTERKTSAFVNTRQEITGKKARKWFLIQAEEFTRDLPYFSYRLIRLATATTEEDRRKEKDVLRAELEQIMQRAEDISALMQVPSVEEKAEEIGFLAWLQWTREEFCKLQNTSAQDEFQRCLKEAEVRPEEERLKQTV